MKLNKPDFINVASIAAALLGLVLALVGCLVLSVQEGIGINLSLSPAVYVGAALIVLGLVCAIAGNVLYNKRSDMNRVLASLALYVAVIALAIWAVGFTVDYVEEHPEVWFDSDDYSHLDGQLCLPDGTCVDTQDLPDDYDWSDLLYDSAPTDVTEWSDQWQTAQGSAPITMELVD